MSISWYCVVGKNQGVSCGKDGPGFRIHLFWFTFGFYSLNIEDVIGGLIEKIDDKKNETNHEEELKDIQERQTKQLNKITEDGAAKIGKLKEEFEEKLEDMEDEVADLSSSNADLEKEKDDIEQELKIVLDYFIRNDSL